MCIGASVIYYNCFTFNNNVIETLLRDPALNLVERHSFKVLLSYIHPCQILTTHRLHIHFYLYPPSSSYFPLWLILFSQILYSFYHPKMLHYLFSCSFNCKPCCIECLRLCPEQRWTSVSSIHLPHPTLPPLIAVLSIFLTVLATWSFSHLWNKLL